MQEATIIFPHQLFKQHPAVASGRKVFLVEETLFFNQYKFHKKKLLLHRASMKFYEDFLYKQSVDVEYIEAKNSFSDVRKLIKKIKSEGYKTIHFTDVSDNWLEKRIKQTAKKHSLKIEEYNSPMFLNSKKELSSYFGSTEKFFHAKFYIEQRKKHNILLDGKKPVGGKWSFDAENRKKYPKNKKPPEVYFLKSNKFIDEAKKYISKNFPNNYGSLENKIIYPVTFNDAKDWLFRFLETRFSEFGPYEDAIVKDENILHHSVLTPMLNIGIIIPREVLDYSVHFAEENNISLNSVEGFVRQIMGWREFIRGVYEYKGSEERTKNFWEFNRKIPESFWKGETGIDPVDITIKKVLETGYAHHIERLMILGNFMLLCEFDPDEVYRWFMELFVDAYDWVMVPNVYGMSQFADGGLMATKPYISGSNYILKMSDFKTGEWQQTWDGLFWRFMHEHRNFFQKNPRLGMLVRNYDKMDKKKQASHLQNANNFLKYLE